MNVDRIKELEKNIIKARHDYYNGQSQVSDKIFDTWIDELSLLDSKNLAVIGIGSEPVSNWDKYTHLVPMGSLNKCQTSDEFIKWAQTYIEKDDELFLTLKLDGLSVSLIYENGILTKAATRGSGITGELITANVAKMQGVPLRLSQKIDATIRGEILLSKKDHIKYFNEYSNTRNAASGISRRYDGYGSDKLTVLVYQIFTDIDFSTQKEEFLLLEKLGFKTPSFYVERKIDNIIKLKEKYQSSLRDTYDFELDGLVIHNNSKSKQSFFGSIHDRARASIAYKFDSIALEANISEIHNQVGNSGRITPVAIFSPKIHLMGVDIERANLHNYNNIKELGIDVGCKVLVCRSNDVIPYVEEVTKSTNTVFSPPTFCPECNEKIIENGEYIQCINFNCSAQVTGRIKNWIKELNILEWGDALLERLVKSKLVVNVADLYKLTTKDLANLDRMGDKSAQKCYDMLWSNIELPLELFLGALSISMNGPNTIKLIVNAGYDTLDKIEKMNIEDFEKVPGVGPVKAKLLKHGLEANKQLISDLLNNGIIIKTKILGKLSGKTICFSGSMINKRAVLEKMATEAGADVKNTVGKNLSFLVIADPDNSQSSKAINARKFGTTLISEEDFLKIIQ